MLKLLAVEVLPEEEEEEEEEEERNTTKTIPCRRKRQGNNNKKVRVTFKKNQTIIHTDSYLWVFLMWQEWMFQHVQTGLSSCLLVICDFSYKSYISVATSPSKDLPVRDTDPHPIASGPHVHQRNINMPMGKLVFTNYVYCHKRLWLRQWAQDEYNSAM